MKTELIHTLTQTFEGHAQQTEDGVEYWLARDLQHLLGYSKWDNFLNIVSKPKTACERSGHTVADHFADVGKMVDLGSGSQREVDDLMLTRYACYLIAQRKWKKTLGPARERIRSKLGLPETCRLKAELHNLLVYAPGQYFVTHQDSEKADDMIATLGCQ